MGEDEEVKEAEIIEDKIDPSEYELKEDKEEKPKKEDPGKIWMVFFLIMTIVAIIILVLWIGGDMKESKDCNEMINNARNSSFNQGYEQGESKAQGIETIINTCNGINCSLFCINKKDFWYIKNDSLMDCKPIKEFNITGVY